jgi:preprotein translocase subunit SecD
MVSVFSAPNVVRGKIVGGRSQIEGMADLEEAKLLEIVLKSRCITCTG